MEELKLKAYTYQAAFEDVMYQEYSSHPQSIKSFMESAERKRPISAKTETAELKEERK